jgi:hypothetical protein
MSDERIQSEPSFVADHLGGRVVRYELSDNLLLQNLRRHFGVIPSLRWVFWSWVFSASLFDFAANLGGNAVEAIVPIFVLLAGWVSFKVWWNYKIIQASLKAVAGLEHRRVEVSFSDDRVFVENVACRSELNWNAITSIHRFEDYWLLNPLLHGAVLVPSNAIDALTEERIETLAASHRVPLAFDPTFQRKLERKTGRRFLTKPSVSNLAGWVVWAVFFALSVVWIYNGLYPDRNAEPPHVFKRR